MVLQAREDGWTIFGRNYGCNDRIEVSSITLDSYGSLVSNAPSLAIIRAVLAMLQHERSASKTKTKIIIIISKGYQRNTKGKYKENIQQSLWESWFY